MSISWEEALGLPLPPKQQTENAQNAQNAQLSSPSPKYTKTYLMPILRQQLKDRLFNREAFKKTYGLNTPNGDGKIRRWLTEIASEMDKVTTEDLNLLKFYCTENLKHKAIKGELESSIELKLALSGVAQKLEVQQEISEKKTVTVNVKSMLSEYNSLLTTEDGTTETTISSDDTAKQVHTSQTDS